MSPCPRNPFHGCRLLGGLALVVCLLASLPVRADYSTPARTVMLDDVPVAYHVSGKPGAPVVILLGGGPGFSSWNLEPVQRRLAAQGFRVVLMDMLGVGENERVLPATPLATWVRQIDRVRDEVAATEPVTLVGHSWGALMALVYTRAHRPAVRGLVLLNPVDPGRLALRGLTVEIDARRRAEEGSDWPVESDWDNSITPAADMANHARAQIERALPAYFLDYAQGRRYARRFSERDFDPELNVAGWKAYRADPVRYATIRAWRLPIGFVGCRQDLLMPESLDALRAQLSLAGVEVLAGCVHFPWEEVPQAFAAALARVMTGVVAGAGVTER